MTPVHYCPACGCRVAVREGKEYCFNCCSHVKGVEKEKVKP